MASKSSSDVPAYLPRHGEIKALIAFARNQGAEYTMILERLKKCYRK